MLIICIILGILAIIAMIYAYYISKKVRKVNREVDAENQSLLNHRQELLEINKEINERIEEKQLEIQRKEKEIENTNNELNSIYIKLNDINTELNYTDKELKDKKNQLKDLQDNILKSADNQQELSQKAFKNYCDTLEKLYKEAEEEYDIEIDALQTSYSNLQLKLIADAEYKKNNIQEELSSIQEELIKIKATRDAVRAAQLKEKEIEMKSHFYCLQISENDLKDVAILDSIKPKLNNPRIMSMLIWQSYFRKPMNTLCNNVIGATVKTGIYKITNQKTKECYIGQAVDLATRWKDHAKCGLGIDAPAGNKLYKAMQEYGIWSFSWEVLEECSREELNEKEKYYIQLYQAKEYGYNTMAGNKGDK